MKMKNETYDTLKWIIAIVLPAAATLIQTVGGAFSWPYTEPTVTIVTAVTTFLGACFMVSSSNYQKRHEVGKLIK